MKHVILIYKVGGGEEWVVEVIKAFDDIGAADRRTRELNTQLAVGYKASLVEVWETLPGRYFKDATIRKGLGT